MAPVTVFRILIVLEILFSALAWASNTEWVESPGATGAAAIYWVAIAAVWLVMLAASVAVFFFMRFGRTLYVATVVFGAIVVYLVGGPANSAEALFSVLDSLCVGAVLAMSWMSPEVAQRFGRKQPNPTTERDAKLPPF